MRMSNVKYPMSNAQWGMSVIEVVLAAAIFTIFASSAVKSLLQNYNANRTGAEFTVATQFASEGLEAVRSIKNQSFSNLNSVDTSTRGLLVGGVSSGQIGYWKMDEGTGTTVGDSSGNGKNGTFGAGGAAPTWNTGKYGGAVNFASSDMVTIDPTFTIPTGDFTYSTWFYITNAGNSGVLFAAENDAGGDNDEMIITVSGSNIGVGLNGASVISVGTSLSTATWYHLAVTRSGSSVTAYLNGSSIGSGTNGSVLNFGDCPLVLGRDPTNGCPSTAYGWYLIGRMDDARVYNRGLSATEVGLLYAGTTGWTFNANGTNDTLVHNSSDNYVRTIKVEPVNRDGSPPSGNIVASGTNDPNTKKITSTVSWNFSSGRPENVSLVTYLSDWIKPIIALGDAILVYTDATSTTSDNNPKYRTYTDSTNTFGDETDTTTSINEGSAIPKTYKIKTSPTKTEAIAGYVTNTGVLRIMCFNGENWSSEWTQTVGGTGTDQRFGIAYETNSGDALVVYSTNTAGTNEMAYRTKVGTSGCGSANWSAGTNINALRTTGIVQWIRMEPNPLAASNNIAIAWVDAARNLTAMEWTGSSFGIAEPASAFSTNVDWTSSTDDIHAYDIAFESVTGNLMLVFGEAVGTCTVGNNCMKYVRYTSSWSSPAAVPTVADRSVVLDLTANPNSNEMVVGAIDDSSLDLSIAYWSGSSWTGRANVDTSVESPPAGAKNLATGWVISGANTRYIVAYEDSNARNIGWYVGNGSGAPTAQTDFTVTPNFTDPQTWYEIQMDPIDKDRLMFIVTDSANDFFAKRLVMNGTTFTWTNADGGAALETNLSQSIVSPAAFAYWRKP